MYEKNIMKFIPVFHQIGEVQSGPPASFIISKMSGPSIGSSINNVVSMGEKVAFSQKGLMRLSSLQTDIPNHFPELEF